MKSCQNSSRLLASTFLKEKKTGDCWLLNIGYPEQLLCLLGITLWVGSYYILQCHIVKLTTYDLRLSLYLRQILPPKIPFFVGRKVQISSKILPQIPNFANFVTFRQQSTSSSRRPVFVISSVFRQKRNPSEPNNVSLDHQSVRAKWHLNPSNGLSKVQRRVRRQTDRQTTLRRDV